MKLNHFKLFSYFILAVVLTLGLSIGLQSLLAAWTAPLASPPTCTAGNPGCDAPLNSGPLMQLKTGALWLNSDGISPYGLIVENGKVGIGVISPSSKLTVASSSSISIDATGGRIQNVADPVNNQDVTTKAWVLANAGGAGGGGGTPKFQTFTASGSWSTPAGVTIAWVTICGGGGGGGGGFADGTHGGQGGGGGGGVCYLQYPVAVAGNVSITVGGGGNGGSGGNRDSLPNNGINGGNSSFGSFTVSGGGGGQAAGGIAGAGGIGGGGLGGYGSLGVNTTYIGTAGENGGSAGGGPGGTGGAPWTSVAGYASGSGGGGGGAGGYGGAGGNGGGYGVGGSNGTGYGSGGGGGGPAGVSGTAGGNGTSGIVIVEWVEGGGGGGGGGGGWYGFCSNYVQGTDWQCGPIWPAKCNPWNPPLTGGVCSCVTGYSSVQFNTLASGQMLFTCIKN